MSDLLVQQINLISKPPVFPTTRFQGSKNKIATWIWENVKDLEFKSVLDAFGGTGAVGYMLKQKSKQVTYNDLLKFNWYIGVALIENDSVILDNHDIDFLNTRHRNIEYPDFVQQTFKDIYFTDDENQWIDIMVTNIEHLDNLYKRAIAYFALFQSCIIKRPFNLFHRKNLYLRFSDVPRNFGNKTTWDTPFEEHFINFICEANQAIFSNDEQNKALNLDVFDITESFDLVYIDTPYISRRGVAVDYLGFYHFLEGLTHYSEWERMIDYRSKHKRLKSQSNPWINKNEIYGTFDKLFKKFRNSILVVSYRSDGIPSISELENLLKKYKSEVRINKMGYKYVLSNNHSEEVLFVGT